MFGAGAIKYRTQKEPIWISQIRQIHVYLRPVWCQAGVEEPIVVPGSMPHSFCSSYETRLIVPSWHKRSKVPNLKQFSSFTPGYGAELRNQVNKSKLVIARSPKFSYWLNAKFDVAISLIAVGDK